MHPPSLSLSDLTPRESEALEAPSTRPHALPHLIATRFLTESTSAHAANDASKARVAIRWGKPPFGHFAAETASSSERRAALLSPEQHAAT